MKLFICITCLLVSAYAQTIQAPSCNATDVQTAMNSINADGAIVIIPVGTCQWSTRVSYTQTNSFIIQGAGAQSAGAYGSSTPTGTNQTTITDAIIHTGSDASLWTITTITGKSFRMTGLAIMTDAANSTTTSNGLVTISGTSHLVRVDHNYFRAIDSGNVGDLALRLSNVWGVVDHNWVDFRANAFGIFHAAWPTADCPSCTLGHGSWHDDSSWGSEKFVFLEDNTFNNLRTTTNTYSNDCANGGRQVIRHNTMLHGAATQQHNGAGGNEGCRATEIYSNNAVNDSTPTGSFIYGRSGGTLAWGNTISGYASVESAYNDRSSSGQVDHSSEVPNGFGMCTGTTPHTGTVTLSGNNWLWASGSQFDTNWLANSIMSIMDGSTRRWFQISGVTNATTLTTVQSPLCSAGTCTYWVGSAWDGNTDYTGYPCINQMGRGKGDLLSGGFPAMVNITTSTQSWPHEALDPLYLWNNAITIGAGGHYWGSGAIYGLTSQVVAENRDFYLELPNPDEVQTFNGTQGIGQGALTARPNTCTPSVAYWDTSGQKLYQCSTPNVWISYYSPYSYPHPLTVPGQIMVTGGVTISGSVVF